MKFLLPFARALRSRPALLAALLGDFFLLGGPHGIPLGTGPSMEAALASQARATEEWIDLDGVVGTAVGTDGRGEYVVKVYLTAAGVAQLPATLAGVSVVPEVTGPFTALDVTLPPPDASAAADDDIDRKGSFPRPVPIGVSTGHPDVTAGTIGARVTDGSRTFALSNNHVYANSNGGRLGDELLQPGAVDGGSAPDDIVGTLYDFEPILFCTGVLCPANHMDAALALTTPNDLGRETPEDGYGGPRARTAEAELGMKVQKYGRTTGHTRGRVSGINATINVGYRDGRARFTDQVVISGDGFSTGGDSGSLIVTDGVLMDDRRPVGLLFAGSRTNTIANPIDVVLERFDVRVDEGR